MSNKYFRKNLIPVAATEATLYTVPAANTAVASSLRITNANSTSSILDVIVYPLGGATPYYLLKTYSLPVHGTMDALSGVPLVLEASDELAIESSEADVTFYLSYLEMDRN
jgi:hypothetical protein